MCALPGALAQTALAAAPTCADLQLVPAVRECYSVDEIPIRDGISIEFLQRDEDEIKKAASLSGPNSVPGNIALPFKEAESDRFTARDLQLAFGTRGVKIGSFEKSIPIWLIRNRDAGTKERLARQKLTFDPQMQDEGYALIPFGNGLEIIADSAAGMFYGAQTVKQLIRGSGKDAVLLVPVIRDWPAMAHRGLSDDWSRGPLPNMEFLKREIRTLAAYKYNIFSPYFEHTFAYASSPIAAFPGGAMTPEEGRELVAYAAQYHIMVIPEQESFGHLHHLLKFEEFAPLAETPHGAVLAPGDDRTLPLISSWFSELAQVFPAPYALIGADETFELGLGRTHDEVKQLGLGAVYLDFLSKIHAALEPNHKRLIFWGDVAVNSPELVGTLPKDMIAAPWDYDPKPDFKPIIEPFTKAGLETWVAPGVNNWNRMYPNNNDALANIRAFVRDGQKLGSTGEMNTVWNDDGEGIFDENWFGILFGAAAGWQPGESSEEAFTASYGMAFHRDPTGKISQAQRELMAAHNAFKKAGLRDGEDVYFWIDPYTPAGQRVAAMIRPEVKEVRLHAERAITLVAEAKAAAKAEGRTLENEEALDALELGARRIDFAGFKFQASDETATLYSQARALVSDKSRWNEIGEMLNGISETNGRIQDMRDGYTLLRGLYQQAWLRDNRPYWLENNLAHYDLAAQLWIGRSDQWNLLREQWWETHALPPAVEVGLPEAPGK
ncbi:MAG: family 20 glycosylhydrolase [Terracidiphilus sp.]